MLTKAVWQCAERLQPVFHVRVAVLMLSGKQRLYNGMCTPSRIMCMSCVLWCQALIDSMQTMCRQVVDVMVQQAGGVSCDSQLISRVLFSTAVVVFGQPSLLSLRVSFRAAGSPVWLLCDVCSMHVMSQRLVLVCGAVCVML